MAIKVSDSVGSEENSSRRVILTVVDVVGGWVYFVGEGNRKGSFPARYLQNDPSLPSLRRHSQVTARFSATELDEAYDVRIEKIYKD